ncbi:MAG: DUF4912 domain-containing protein [Desulfotomaculales bacterium]
MTALVWVLGILVLALAAGIFLWLRHKSRAAKPVPDAFKVETASELMPPASGPQPGASDKQEPDLPPRYGEDKIVLMARDPNWLFAYWEITAAKQEEQGIEPNIWQASRPVLRVYDVTNVEFNGTNANSFVDIPITEEADRWHIQVGRPDRSFCVELGRVLPGGSFIGLLRSNIVTTPRASLSEAVDEEWMWIEGIYRSMLRFQTGISSPLLIEAVRERMGVIPLGFASPVLLPPEKGD